jgi:hypothetical protein
MIDWSEILTQSEAEHMQRILQELQEVEWAEPLVREIANRGGITYDTKPLLFEARVAHTLHRKRIADVQYEYAAGVGDSTVDFRFGTAPEFLVEVVSIGRSAAVERATFHNGPMFGTILTSPHSDQSEEERQESEEGEGLLAIQKIGEKVYGRRAPVKFPLPQESRYHVVVVDMRGHLGGGDIDDWRQIAFGAEAVVPEWRKHWLGKDGNPMPVRGVWHPDNPMRFAATARERLHAIMFVAEEHYQDDGLGIGSWTAANPHLFAAEEEARRALDLFPLRNST